MQIFLYIIIVSLNYIITQISILLYNNTDSVSIIFIYILQYILKSFSKYKHLKLLPTIKLYHVSIFLSKYIRCILAIFCNNLQLL